MSQYIDITYNSPTDEERVIEVVVDETPTNDSMRTDTGEWEKVPKKGTITLRANAAGFGWMVSLITDFLLNEHPEEFVYRLETNSDLVEGSPTLRFAFDPNL
jgi:hypothetical protein